MITIIEMVTHVAARVKRVVVNQVTHVAVRVKRVVVNQEIHIALRVKQVVAKYTCCSQSCLHFSMCARHPCARAMLTFSASFQV